MHAPRAHDPTHHPRRPWTALIVLCAAQFMVVLDITVVNVALPSIGADLGFAAEDLQWVVTAYVLLTGGLLLLGGRVADALGRRRTFLAGLTVFTAASLASALAPSPEALVASRAAQGLGAALLTPSALAIVTATYSGPQRTTALSVWGAIGSAGAAAGVVLGGMLTTWLSWEWIFLVNVPIGVACGVLVSRLVAPSPAQANRPLDVPGAVTLVGGLGMLVFALDGTARHGWGSARTLVLLALSAALLATFAAVERGARRPLVPPATWRDRSLIAGATVMLGVTGILVAAFFLTSLYLQRELDASALAAGLGFLPMTVAIGLAAHLAAHLLSHLGTRVVIVAGLLVIGAGALALAAAPDHAGYAGDLLPGLLALGFGVGLVFPAASVTGMARVHGDQAGLASGVMSTAHELGAALGVAVLSAIAAGKALPLGYQDGFIAASLAAAALAVLALFAVPAIRPAGEARMAMH
jgi:EmrB/QacA subfamily drug resistance transporter